VADKEHDWLIRLGFFDRGTVPIGPDWRDWMHGVFVQNGPVSSDDLHLMAALAISEVAEAACERVSRDVLSSTGSSIIVKIVDSDGVSRVQIDGQLASGTGVRSARLEHLTVDVADAVQEHLIEHLWRPWPECVRHRHGVHPEVRDGKASWVCRVGDHAVAEIGQFDRRDQLTARRRAKPKRSR